MSTDDDSFDELYKSIGLSKPAPRSPRGRKKAEPAKAPRRSRLPPPEPHPLTPAGPKLKVLREKSGWTVEEIADRTGVDMDTLAAFEEGESGAAEEVTLADLEHLASACCGSVSDLLSPEERREAKRKEMRRKTGSAFDPFNF
jgi:DNA-binding XRE family transcriptional regulator